MAEIQIIPAAFNLTAEQQQQPNAGLVGGGVATDIRDPATVVGNVEDVVDLDDREEGRDAETAQDRLASENLQTADNAVQVRVDYDTEDQQVYLEFIDPRTETVLTTVPSRQNLNFDTEEIRRRAVGADEATTSVTVPPPPTGDLAPAPAPFAPPEAQQAQAPNFTGVPEQDRAEQREAPALVPDNDPTEIIDVVREAQAQEFAAAQQVRTATEEQRGILDNL